MAEFFAGFTEQTIALEPNRHIRLRRAGTGPALLMLHGMPQTHVIWHRIAPILAAHFTVICPDLTGYGQSYKPPATADHAPYAKRAMARDMVDLMDHLGQPNFALIGHDRGARVAHRLALDHPHRVQKLMLLDIIPSIEHFERTDMAFALGYYHWFFLAQPHPLPEALINLDPALWLRAQSGRHHTANSIFADEAMADYLAAAANPATITAMCEDYRAAASIDLEHDRASRDAGTKIACPTLILWGARGLVGRLYAPLDIWSQYCATKVTGSAITGGHYLAEEAPGETLAQIQAFLSGGE
jgi:haloacetate dehalogenase